jgi:hypothetical protein
MTYTLTEAAKATGKAKSTIHFAIKKGRISVQKNDLGEYVIDPAELHRVFPPNVQKNDESNNPEQNTNTKLLIENEQLKARLEAMGELKHQIEAERDNLREQNNRITALLAAPKPDPYVAILERLETIEKASLPPTPAEERKPKSFWSRLVG